MHADLRADRDFLPSRRLVLIGAVLIAVFVVIAGAAVLERRAEALGHSRQLAASLGTALARETARSVRAVDRILQETAGKVVAAETGGPDRVEALISGVELHEFLRGALAKLPQAGSLEVIDADGRLVNGSRIWPAPILDVAEREEYRHFRETGDEGVFIGAPSIDHSTGAASFLLARRIGGAGDRFLGVVSARIDIGYLRHLYRAIGFEIGGVAALLRRDGMILTRWPPTVTVTPPGRMLPAGSIFYRLLERDGGSARAAAPIGGADSLVRVQPLKGFPLVVAVSIPDAAALAVWRRQAILIAVLTACTTLAFALLFRALVARSRRLELSEATLRESEARFRDFALTSSDWLWETDREHRFTFLSEHIRAFGQDPRNRARRTRIELAADVEREPAKWREHQALLERHEPFRDFVYTRKVGSDPEHTVSVSGNPVFDPDGQFLGYRGTARNITERVRAEHELRQAKAAAEAANLAKSQFLANMSHELRTPLNAILGFAELLEGGVAGPLEPRQREYAGLIHQSGEHLLHVINEILDLARVDAGKLALQEESGIDPRRLIDQCLRLVAGQPNAAALEFSVEVEEPAPFLVADRTRLLEILLNLSSNAVKFTAPGGRITIDLRRTADGGVAFAVCDTGPGMNAAEIAIALEPFGQVESGLDRRSEGTGLGLPLARRFAELHGGSLEIDSEKGVGTTVTVFLPASRVQPPPPSAAPADLMPLSVAGG